MPRHEHLRWSKQRREESNDERINKKERVRSHLVELRQQETVGQVDAFDGASPPCGTGEMRRAQKQSTRKKKSTHDRDRAAGWIRGK